MTQIEFKGKIAAFPTDVPTFKKAIYAVTDNGRLAQIWEDTGGWHISFPAEDAGYTGTFKGGVAVFPTDKPTFKKAIYAVTDNGKLMQLWDAWGPWQKDFPAEMAGYTGTFKAGVAVFPTNVSTIKKAIYAVTSNGRLAQIWDTTSWNISYPAEDAGYTRTIRGSVAVFATDASNFKKAIYAVTDNGKLIQLWDVWGPWQKDFPAEMAGYTKPFRGGVAVFPINVPNFEKAIYAVTDDGRLVEIWDRGILDTTDRWRMSFPAEMARYKEAFKGGTAVFPTSIPNFEKAVYAVTDDRRLAQLWDTSDPDIPERWRISFPAEST